MSRGTYKPHPQRTTYKDYVVDRFVPHMFDPFYAISSCGATALSLLIGKSPFDYTHIVSDGAISTADFLKELTAEGFRYEELTLCSLSNAPLCQDGYLTNAIDTNHVVVLVQLYHKHNATYTVTWNNLIWHNFDINPVRPLEFLNRPILQGWVVHHPNWDMPKTKNAD